MASQQHRVSSISPEEYLALERKAVQKSEYYAGEIFLMVGTTEFHNLIAINIQSELRTQLKNRPCKVYASDMRLKVSETGLYTYPDAMVACEKVLFEGEKRDILLNPIFIVEVLSESTEGYDRGKKFEHYRRIDSFLEYLLVAQDQHHVEHYVKQKNGAWLFSEARSLDETIKLPSIDCELALSEIYDKVDIESHEKHAAGHVEN